jgi:hypothetical protein
MLFELVSVYFLLKGNLPENELDDIKGGLLLEVALDARLILPLHTGRFDEFFWIIFHFLILFLPLGHRITKSYFLTSVFMPKSVLYDGLS